MLTNRLLSPNQVADIYQTHMQQDFPPAEVKPLAVLQALMQRGAYAPYGWFDEADHLIAYTFFAQAPQSQVLLLDYFAVCSQYRNHGYGGQILAQIGALWRGRAGVLAEVENPAESNSDEERTIRTRRANFYQRNGLRATTVRSVLFGVPYILHYLPVDEEPTDEQLMEALAHIYHVLFPQSVYQANGRLWRAAGEAQ